MGPQKGGPGIGERPREAATGVARSSQAEGTLQTGVGGSHVGH